MKNVTEYKQFSPRKLLRHQKKIKIEKKFNNSVIKAVNYIQYSVSKYLKN